MLFNSIDFAIFLPIVFILYWFVTQKSLKLQNALIVIASYVFYGWWDWRFLFLIIFSTIVDYIIGILLSEEENAVKRKFYLGISIFLAAENKIKIEHPFILLFIFGAALGSFLLFCSYIIFVKVISKKVAFIAKNINLILSLLFLGLGILTLFKVLH